jgi:hypothetical protein
LLRPWIERLWLCVSKRGLGNRFLLNALSAVGLAVVATLAALVPAAAAGYVSSARRLESPIVPQCLANIDFAQRVSVDRSGLSVPPIAIRDPRNLLIPAVGCGDETILRDLKFTLATNAGIGGH